MAEKRVPKLPQSTPVVPLSFKKAGFVPLAQAFGFPQRFKRRVDVRSKQDLATGVRVSN